MTDIIKRIDAELAAEMLGSKTGRIALQLARAEIERLRRLNEQIQRIVDGPCVDHDWEFVRDWEGDPGVINGTHDISFWRCRDCELEDHDRPAPAHELFDPQDTYEERHR